MRFIILSLIIYYATSNMLNKQETCTFFKDSIYKIIKEVKELNPEQKNSLNQYSYRGFVHDLANFAKFENIDSFNIKKFTITTKFKGNLFSLYFSDNEPKIIYDKEEDEYKNAIAIKDKLGSNINQLNKGLNEYKRLMNEKVIGFSDEIKKKINTVNICNSFSEQLKIYDEPNMFLFDILEDIKKEIKLNNKNFDININKLKDLSNDIQKLKFLTSTFDDYQNKILNQSFETILYQDLIYNNKSLTKKYTTMKKSAKKLIDSLKKVLDSNCKQELKLLLAFKDYKDYINLYAKAKDNVSYIQNEKIKLLENEKLIEEKSDKLQLKKWMRHRFYTNEIDKFEKKMEAIDYYLSVDDSVFNDIKDKYLKKDIQNFAKIVSENKSGMNSTKLIYETINTNVKSLKNFEEQIDKFLAMIIGYLQYGDDLDKCFSSSELTTLLYYMNITQIIFDQKTFNHNLLNLTDKFDVQKSEKGASKFLLKYDEVSYNDIIENSNPQDRKELIEMKMTSFMIKENYRIIGELQKNKINDNQNILYRSLMKAAGFTIEAIKFAGTYTVVSLIIKKLLIAIFGSISIGLGYGIAIYLAVGLVKFLLHEILHWVQHKYNLDGDKIKSIFVSIFKSVGKYFSTEFISLDFEKLLENQAINELDMLKKKSKILTTVKKENEKLALEELEILFERRKRAEILKISTQNSEELILI